MKTQPVTFAAMTDLHLDIMHDGMMRRSQVVFSYQFSSISFRINTLVRNELVFYLCVLLYEFLCRETTVAATFCIANMRPVVYIFHLPW